MIFPDTYKDTSSEIFQGLHKKINGVFLPLGITLEIFSKNFSKDSLRTFTENLLHTYIGKISGKTSEISLWGFLRESMKVLTCIRPCKKKVQIATISAIIDGFP